jgi:hypothetical protein
VCVQDIEGHRGADGRYYMVRVDSCCCRNSRALLAKVDFARLFPPEPAASIVLAASEAAATSTTSTSPTFDTSAAARVRAFPTARAPALASAVPPLPTGRRGSHLYALLRPELVRQHVRPLNSDAVSARARVCVCVCMRVRLYVIVHTGHVLLAISS